MTESASPVPSAEQPVSCKLHHLPHCTQSGYAQDVPHLSGSTPDQRHAQLLKNHNLEELIPLSETLEKKYRINKYLPTCIAKADTSLGRFLKTKNNIGNVFNTDSWKTWTPASLQEGYEAIFKTLNNKYLWQHTQIWQLSGKRNPLGPNYATSKEARETNVLNCLSVIYGKTINHDYEFRI